MNMFVFFEIFLARPNELSYKFSENAHEIIKFSYILHLKTFQGQLEIKDYTPPPKKRPFFCGGGRGSKCFLEVSYCHVKHYLFFESLYWTQPVFLQKFQEPGGFLGHRPIRIGQKTRKKCTKLAKRCVSRSNFERGERPEVTILNFRIHLIPILKSTKFEVFAHTRHILQKFWIFSEPFVYQY